MLICGKLIAFVKIKEIFIKSVGFLVKTHAQLIWGKIFTSAKKRLIPRGVHGSVRFESAQDRL